MDYLFARAAQTREPLESMVVEEDLARLRIALATLSEKDRRILTMRFGLNGKRVHSSAQVAISQGLPPQHAEMLIGAARARLIAAFVANKDSVSSPKTSGPPSSDTSKTLTTSPSPKVSRTEALPTPNAKSDVRSPKTD